jgi:diguanylate cyclase
MTAANQPRADNPALFAPDGAPVKHEMMIGLTMVNGLGQMALVAVFYGIIRRLEIGRRSRSMALGCLFGSGAILAMLSTSEVVPGVLVDTRAILVGLAGAFAGVPAGLITGAIAILFRAWLGGVGASLGIIGIAIATLAGIAWLKLLPRRCRDRPSGLVILAGGIALHTLLALVSTRLDPGFLYLYFPLLWGTCLVATLALGWMMQRENGLIQREKSLADFAYPDALTGLANRRAFDRRMQLDDLLGRKGALSVVILDVDLFKAVNDRHGHDAGDAVLRGIAQAIQDDVRDNDLVTRHGGEEFAILLPGTDLAAGRVIAERIRAKIAGLPLPFAGGTLRVTASFGVAAASGGGSRKGLVSAADTALYAAKAGGRNRVEVAALPGPPERDLRQPAPAPAI